MRFVLASVQTLPYDDPALELSAACQCSGVEVVEGDTGVM